MYEQWTNKQVCTLHTQTNTQIQTDAHTICKNTQMRKWTSIVVEAKNLYQLYVFSSRVLLTRQTSITDHCPEETRASSCPVPWWWVGGYEHEHWTSIFNNDININNIRPLSSGNICIILTSPMMMSRRRSTRTWTSISINDININNTDHCPDEKRALSWPVPWCWVGV